MNIGGKWRKRAFLIGLITIVLVVLLKGYMRRIDIGYIATVIGGLIGLLLYYHKPVNLKIEKALSAQIVGILTSIVITTIYLVTFMVLLSSYRIYETRLFVVGFLMVMVLSYILGVWLVYSRLKKYFDKYGDFINRIRFGGLG